MSFKYAFLGLAVATFLVLTGCDTDDGPMEKAGEKIDNAVQTTGDKVENAMDSAEKKADETTR